LDADRIKDGRWVTVEVDGEPFEIKTRGFTARYRDTFQRLRMERVREINRKTDPGAVMVSVDTLPPSVEDLCLGRALADECFLDVRGLLETDDGPAVTKEAFRALLLEPEANRLFLQLAQAAASEVTSDRSALAQANAGNSATASDGT
jgi:hypothetical protein